jgi:hypothetical protein
LGLEETFHQILSFGDILNFSDIALRFSLIETTVLEQLACLMLIKSSLVDHFYPVDIRLYKEQCTFIDDV